ncbi:ribosome silencing factor [Propionibacterium australiense]|uniref:Ribosomal silencing factor RsfS n=1 Tax=Propionibacterium australiense TaxID=119981 RepID=A0A8B3FPZ9_9ACTN|nr:ribosome silencing factor [Propionibacterium australiense]RLP10993.1 ribosome silencing factor [Propionibacterium australiense]RLP13041.1 ribosome silencing factor [Propionibacterium australiense]VEH90979.1 ribosome-associated protein [Propionibacterium australiense]
MSATDHALHITQAAASAAAAKLAENIEAFDVSEQLAIADVFLVLSGRTERQVGAIVDAVEERLVEWGERPLRREGYGANRWVLLDYGDLIVHVMHVDDRATYGLERLWGDCPAIALEANRADAARTVASAVDGQ